MFYKPFFLILFIFAVIITIGICVKKPPIHSALLVYNSDYEIIKTTNTETQQKTQSVSTQSAPAQKQTTKIKEKTVQSKSLYPQTNTKRKNETLNVQSIKKSTHTQNLKQTENIKTQNKVQYVNKKEEINEQYSTPQVQVKTSYQEEIEWNKWRSNIQNKIMADTRLPIVPQGTIFRFSFDVDKYGKVSNVQTWSESPAFTPYAIQYIAPVIRSYQGRSILDFPTGSNRTTTTVNGHWKISSSQKYSNSSNFHDIETVKKGN